MQESDTACQKEDWSADQCVCQRRKENKRGTRGGRKTGRQEAGNELLTMLGYSAADLLHNLEESGIIPMLQRPKLRLREFWEFCRGLTAEHSRARLIQVILPCIPTLHQNVSYCTPQTAKCQQMLHSDSLCGVIPGLRETSLFGGKFQRFKHFQHFIIHFISQ